MSRRRVVVVGCGPAGAALSLMLCRNGIEVLLVEREANFDRVFRGEALMPSGVDALRQMGFSEEFDRLPSMAVPSMELFVDGRRVIRADWPEVGGANSAVVVSQVALIESLTRQASTGPFELRLDTRAVAIDDAGKQPAVTLASAKGTSVVKADLVVGADGRASTVRSHLGVKLQRLRFPGDVAWLSIPAPDTQRLDPRFQAFSTKGQSLVLYPSWDNNVRVGVNLSSSAFSPGKADVLARIAGIAGEPYASIVRTEADAIDDPVHLKVLVGRATQWSKGRVLLLGDAAHPMAPVRAQGINLALRDAIVAANHLVPALTSGDDGPVETVIGRVQAERQPEVEAIQALQIEAMTLPPAFRLPALRMTVLPVMRRLGIAKRIMLKTERPFRHGITEVRLRV